MTAFKRAFADSPIFIYCLEDHPSFGEKAMSFFLDCRERDVEIVTSAVTVAEYLVYPYAERRFDLIRNFRSFLHFMEVEVVDITPDIAEESAQVRAACPGIKGMDALQIAAGLVSGCDLFLTNDEQLRQIKDIRCAMLEELY